MVLLADHKQGDCLCVLRAGMVSSCATRNMAVIYSEIKRAKNLINVTIIVILFEMLLTFLGSVLVCYYDFTVKIRTVLHQNLNARPTGGQQVEKNA